MTSLEALFGLLLAALAIALVAKRLDLPYPIALVVGGIGIALIPGLPIIRLDPHLVFFLLLPPILSEAAYFTSWRDFWRWRRAIFLLAFGLVAATSAVVAALCVWLIPGMTWGAGFVLGAIVSPPDAAAATSIMRGLKMPRRIVQILEGESLVNDAAGLTVYRFAVAAVATGSFSLGGAIVSFLWIAVGGTVIGVALGSVYVRLYPRLKDPDVEILSTFMLGYVAYFLAEEVHASGVLAAVAAGLILGWHSPRIFSATMRIRGTAVWQSFIFFLNVLIFFLIGLQVPSVVRGLAAYSLRDLLWWCGAVSVGVIAVRLAWVYPHAYLPRWLSRRVRETEPDPGWKAVTVVGWTGLRGVVSLAGALALPERIEGGLPFPYRDEILLVTFAVILATLLFQGLTLRPLIKLLKLPTDRTSEEEQLTARIFSVEQALERLVELERQQVAPENVVNRVRSYFEDQLADLRARLEIERGADCPELPEQFQTIAEQRVWWELARAEREALMRLREDRTIGDEAMRELEREIDLLEARIVPR